MEVRGLACPSCGGTVPLAEGSRITTCATCGTTLLAQGDLGHPRYVVSVRAQRDLVLANLRAWWHQFDKARDLAAQARITDSFLVFVPVWRITGRVVGWVLGEEERKEGEKKVLAPVERRVNAQWDVNRAACDLGELGIRSVHLASEFLDAFDDEKVEKQGMIFRPLTPASEIRTFAKERLLEQGRKAAGVDRVTQAFLNVVGVSQSLVYYPLWVIRYEYRQRMYQATADGATGSLLFGRAPGNDIYRVLCFLIGMAGGNFLLTSVLHGLIFDVSLSPYVFVAIVSASMMYWGYRRFRYGAEVTIGGEESWSPIQLVVADLSKTAGQK
jgi:hypothetical protein